MNASIVVAQYYITRTPFGGHVLKTAREHVPNRARTCVTARGNPRRSFHALRLTMDAVNATGTTWRRGTSRCRVRRQDAGVTARIQREILRLRLVVGLPANAEESPLGQSSLHSSGPCRRRSTNDARASLHLACARVHVLALLLRTSVTYRVALCCTQPARQPRRGAPSRKWSRRPSVAHALDSWPRVPLTLQAVHRKRLLPDTATGHAAAAAANCR